MTFRSAAGPATLQVAWAKAARVNASEARASGVFGDLATVGPSVDVEVGPTGALLVIVGAQLGHDTLNQQAVMGFAIAGATVVAPSDGYALAAAFAIVNVGQALSRSMYVDGLNQGTHTLTAKYRNNAAGNAFFTYRTIAAFPL